MSMEQGDLFDDGWEAWYTAFIFLVLPDEMAEEYLRVREILKDFKRIDDAPDV